MAHPEVFKTTTEQRPWDFGISDQEFIMRAFQYAFLEHYHRDRTKQERESSAIPVVDYEEQSFFMGTNGQESGVMISPELITHVAKELERSSSIDKQARKAREERALRRK